MGEQLRLGSISRPGVGGRVAVAVMATASCVVGGQTAAHASTGVTISVICGTGVTCTDGRLQAAINASSSGDAILVYPGTYRELLNFEGKAVRVKSADGPSVTTVDGAQMGTVVTFDSGETRQAILQGFTIEGGDASGIVIAGGASPTIRADVVTGNTNCTGGAGIDITTGSPLIVGNTITANVGGHILGCGGYLAGGGIDVFASTATITGNRIADNVMDAGAGIAVDDGAVTIEDNVIEDNSNDGQGGASGVEIFNALTGTSVVQNLIVNNDGTGAYSSAVRFATLGSVSFTDNTVVSTSEMYAVWIDPSSAPPSLINNIIDGGTTPLACGTSYAVNPYLSHNDVYGPSAPTGVCAQLVLTQSNIRVAPKFVDASALRFRELASSPTVGAGELKDATHPFVLPVTDLGGKPRVTDNSVDMGAYQRPGNAT
jgi:Right handed beta helix region